MKRLSAVLALFALIVAGCGGGSGGSTGLPAGVQPGVAAGSATLVIPNSATTTSANNRQPRFVAVSATSVKISVPALADQIFSIASGSTNCTTANNARTCTLAFTAIAGQPAITVTLYDGANATGNVLGSATATPSVTAGVPFTVNLAIGGAIKTVTINLSSGFTMGTAGSATVTVTAVDADGNTITGPGNFASPLTLQNTDTSGAFTLSGTAIAGPTSSVTLTYNGANVSGTVLINGSVLQSGVQVNGASVFGNSSPAPVSCGTALPLPGVYTSIVSVGTVSGSTYSAIVSGATPPSTWLQFQYVASPTPVPTATAASTATAGPTSTPGQPVYLYQGTYHLASGTTGCIFAFATQDGSPLSGLTGSSAGANALADGTPFVQGAGTVASSLVFGNLTSLVINNLGATGGTGTVTLDNLDSGTVTLTTRTSTTTDKLRKASEQARRH